jgi:hypothetical protein
LFWTVILPTEWVFDLFIVLLSNIILLIKDGQKDESAQQPQETSHDTQIATRGIRTH